ncbi:MAG: DinB family protein [Thalassovita sp.]
MISPDYCVMMARYNAWQNGQMKTALVALDHAALIAERGAFFGSILKTANHLIWGDMIWMARFDNTARPEGGIAESTGLTPTCAAWAVARFDMDARILRWAENLQTVDLIGDQVWYSQSAKAEVSKPTAQCVTHFFNHQTHHRGQIHGMVTAAGGQGWTSDLFMLPEQGPWL